MYCIKIPRVRWIAGRSLKPTRRGTVMTLLQGLKKRITSQFGSSVRPRAANSDLSCPRCRHRLLERCRYEGQEVDLCPHCAGLWCEPLKAPRTAHELSVQPSEPSALSVVKEEGPLRCPECQLKLDRFQVKDVKGLELDHCRECNGVWFDHREWQFLGAVRRWRAHLLNQHKKPPGWNGSSNSCPASLWSSMFVPGVSQQ